MSVENEKYNAKNIFDIDSLNYTLLAKMKDQNTS